MAPRAETKPQGRILIADDEAAIANGLSAILSDAGYSGYVALEMEGKEHADTAVPKSIEILRKAFGV